MEEFRVYNTIDSTNVEAHRLLTDPSIIAHGTTLVAHAQTGGKGQFGRQWHSEPGKHIAMSVILKPDNQTAADLPRISKLISLAVVNSIEETDPLLHPLIKWPNDIYINDKKAGGLLIENTIAGNRLLHIIVGLGLNINEEAFPSTLPNAISLHMITGRSYDVLSLAKTIRATMLQLIEHPSADWESIYHRRLYKLNESVTFHHCGSKLAGIIHDVDEHGRLVLRNGDQLQSYNTHELTWII